MIRRSPRQKPGSRGGLCGNRGARPPPPHPHPREGHRLLPVAKKRFSAMGDDSPDAALCWNLINGIGFVYIQFQWYTAFLPFQALTPRRPCLRVRTAVPDPNPPQRRLFSRHRTCCCMKSQTVFIQFDPSQIKTLRGARPAPGSPSSAGTGRPRPLLPAAPGLRTAVLPLPPPLLLPRSHIHSFGGKSGSDGLGRSRAATRASAAPPGRGGTCAGAPGLTLSRSHEAPRRRRARRPMLRSGQRHETPPASTRCDGPTDLRAPRGRCCGSALRPAPADRETPHAGQARPHGLPRARRRLRPPARAAAAAGNLPNP